jgi:hypothetical protein
MNRDLYGYDAVLVGWGRTIHNETPAILETASLRFIVNRECEIRVQNLVRQFMPIHYRFLCTAASPYVLLNFVSIDLFI